MTTALQPLIIRAIDLRAGDTFERHGHMWTVADVTTTGAYGSVVVHAEEGTLYLSRMLQLAVTRILPAVVEVEARTLTTDDVLCDEQGEAFAVVEVVAGDEVTVYVSAIVVETGALASYVYAADETVRVYERETQSRETFDADAA